MKRAKARHILVKTEKECKELKKKIKTEKDFSELAGKHSSCPSSKEGGDLGEFSPGDMVPEFDAVVFSEPVGVPHGPVKTDFGYHLIWITSRVEK